MSVVLETSLGDMVFDLYHVERPAACLNFLKLCKLKRYNDGHFYHVEKGFVARACDSARCEVNPGSSIYSLISSISTPPSQSDIIHKSHRKVGVISFPNSIDGHPNGSQFFITLQEGLDYLDKSHVPFGELTEGLDVLEKIASIQVASDTHRPYRVVRIRHTIVLHDPFDDPVSMTMNIPSSPPPMQEPPSGYLPSDEEHDDDLYNAAGDENLMAERAAAREANSAAQVLEIIGDLPDADVKPPDNVLFVCRLNPITEGDDLEIIFSRFGNCTADVIRDPKTGASLNYAFIEYENSKQCENAFHKMDKALVDDRRIRVDFSQSVSRLWNENRRRRRRQSDMFKAKQKR